MIEGGLISKPAILKRLANEELDKTLFNLSRLKYERKRKLSNKRLGDN